MTNLIAGICRPKRPIFIVIPVGVHGTRKAANSTSPATTTPIPGRFRSDNSPQIREPLEALIDARVRLVFIIAAIQSGKTSVGELGLCHIIANLPGPTLWLDQTGADAKDQAESRLHKLFEDCAPVKALFPSDRHKKRNTTIHFRNGMPLWVLGAHNKTNLQRRSIRWLIGDETVACSPKVDPGAMRV